MTRTAVIRAAFPRFIIREGGKEEAWRAGANGQNNPWRIWIWSGIENRAAVAAQELYEWRFRMLVGLGAAIAVGALTASLAAVFEPLLWWLVPLTAWAAFVLVPQIHFIERRKELMSHEIENQCATKLYGADLIEMRLREIGDRDHPEQGGMVSYAWLRGMTEEEIYQGMEANAGKAMRWLKRNQPFLEEIRDFEFEGDA